MTATATTLNGFDLAALQATVKNVRKHPEAGRVTFRGRTVWAGGPAGDGHTESMEQLGQLTPRHFTARGDHPPALLGRDTGPTAGEALLAALGSCLTATYASHATARGVALHGLEVSVGGELDLGGFLQTAQTRAGFQRIQAVISVRAEADEATLADLCRVTTLASPVFDTISRGVPVSASVERLPDGGAR